MHITKQASTMKRYTQLLAIGGMVSCLSVFAYERPYIREFAEKHNYTPYQAVSRLVTIDDELKFTRGDKEVIKAYCYRENTNPKTAAEQGIGQ